MSEASRPLQYGKGARGLHRYWVWLPFGVVLARPAQAVVESMVEDSDCRWDVAIEMARRGAQFKGIARSTSNANLAPTGIIMSLVLQNATTHQKQVDKHLIKHPQTPQNIRHTNKHSDVLQITSESNKFEHN